MTLTDSRLQAALHAATDHLHAAVAAVSARVTERLSAAAQSATRIAERDLLIATQFDMRRNAGVLQRVFADELTDRLEQDLTPRDDKAKRRSAAADWQTLTLVDDAEMEERMFSDRIGQQISHACESELRELAAYMGALLQTGSADNERNPLRAEVIGAAIYRGIEAVSPQPDTRKLLAREIGTELAKEMPACYAQILRGLQARGVQPVGLSVRQVDGPGNALPGVNSGYATLNAARTHATDFDAGPSGHGRSTHHDAGSRYGPATTRDSGRSGTVASGRHSLEPQMAANAQLMTLLRQLTAIASRPGEFDPAPAGWPASGGGARSTGGGFGASSGGTPPWSASRGPIASAFGAAGASRFAGEPGDAPFAADGMTHLAAVNLIRAHRDELMQASNGQLDHMVIDVVGSLFDQILSDSRVPPQMARQIARLQLPVLRVALSDPSFFSSRRHPVRRFVNRIASLACAFDDFDDGPGRQFLERVRALVQEIVDGDFDQIELYAGKLAALENFIAEQTGHEVEQRGAVATLGSKESELRLQQRYTMQLQSALQPMALPPYLHEFLAQVWSQALVLAASRDGADSDRAARYRRVGRDLVMSVQPKGSPALRKRFLMQLPPLMKDLNEGLALIGWSDAAQREFFGKLLPAHAESLKGAAQSELDHNLMVKQLEAIFGIAVPGVEQLSAADAVPELDGEVIAQRFSAEEALQVGLVTESAVDWSGNVDIDLGALGEAEDTNADTGPDSSDVAALDTDASATLPLAGGIDLDLGNPDPAEPSRGAGLIDHIKLGFAYQMHLKDDWQKVRLAHVSAGRSFFVFTRGRKHQETISMTSRMLARMCETGRLRAVESAYLMERATRRARKQLAAMGRPTGH